MHWKDDVQVAHELVVDHRIEIMKNLEILMM